MAGILANSADRTMESGDTATTNAVSGFVTGEEITLSTTPTGTVYAWGQTVPGNSARAKSGLDSATVESPVFTPDVAGIYVITCVVDSVTVYVLTLSVVAAQGVLTPGASQFTPVANVAVPTPLIGATLFYSSDDDTLALKDTAGVVRPIDTAATVVTSVSGTAPISSSGGTTPAISISPATTGAAGSMSAADKVILDGLPASVIAALATAEAYTDTVAAGLVPTSRTLTAGTGLSGGGDLSTNRSLSCSFGSSSGTVCQGNDTRLSDARTPTAHASSHQNGGSDEVATATAAANAIPKAGAGGKLDIGWVPTGSTSSTVCIGNDSRLSTETLAATLAAGATTGGTSPTLSAADNLLGTAITGIGAAYLNLDNGAASLTGGTATEHAGGAVSLTASSGATATATNRNGGSVLLTSGNAVVAGTGGSVSIAAGSGGASGAAGIVNINAGVGGSSSGTGGTATVAGGSGGSSTGAGGQATFKGGDGGSAANGGLAILQGGAGGSSSGTGGDATVQGGTATDGNGGSGNLNGGAGVGTNRTGGAATVSAGAATGSGTGGNVVITAGGAGATGTAGITFVRGGAGGSTSGNGGDVRVQAGIPVDGNGGSIQITPRAGVGTNRNGGSLTSSAGNATGSGTGGSFSFTAGSGGVTGVAGTATFNGGAGGSTSGAAGGVAFNGGTPVDGNGADITLTASAGATTTATARNGGSVAIQAGAAVSGGTTGSVSLKDSAGATKIQINATGCGFFATAPVAKPTVTGSRGGNAALASLLTALSNLGLITDSTSA